MNVITAIFCKFYRQKLTMSKITNLKYYYENDGDKTNFEDVILKSIKVKLT